MIKEYFENISLFSLICLWNSVIYEVM